MRFGRLEKRGGGTRSKHAVEEASTWHGGEVASNMEDVLRRVDSAEVQEIELAVRSPMACQIGVSGG